MLSDNSQCDPGWDTAMEVFYYVYLSIGHFGLPAMLLFVGLKLISAGYYKHLGIFMCVMSPILLVASRTNSEPFVMGILPMACFCFGLLMVILGMKVIIDFRKIESLSSEFDPRDCKAEEKSMKQISEEKKSEGSNQVLSKHFGVLIIIIGLVIISYIPVSMVIVPKYNENNLERLQNEYPLTMAFKIKNVGEMESLLQNGADPNEMMDGITLMKRVIDESSSFYGYEIRSIVEMLLESGYNVQETDEDGVTLLMYTNRMSWWDADDRYDLRYTLTQWLIEYGAEVNAKDINGRTALMWACNYKGHLSDKSVNLDTTPYIHTEFEDGRTTIPSFKYDQIKSLVDNGADVGAQDKNGFRALDYFRFAVEENSKNDHPQAIKLYQSKEYLDMVDAIEELLKYE